MAAKGVDEKNAMSRLAAARQRMDGLRARGQVPAGREAGPGRIDAIGHILNEVFGQQYSDPNSAAPIQVPVSVPAVWNAARLQCVQTNCLTSNSLTRNVGEVLGASVIPRPTRIRRDAGACARPRKSRISTTRRGARLGGEPKWSPKFPAPKGVAEGAKAFATYCQRCHAQPYLDKFSAQWDAAGENWRGTNAPSDLTDHFVAEDYLGQTRYVWRVTKVGFESVGTDDQFIKVHTGSRYTLNARATEILDGKMRDGILQRSARRSGTCRRRWLPGSRSSRAATSRSRDKRSSTRSSTSSRRPSSPPRIRCASLTVQ